jgi:hypothetical protein
VVVVDGGAVVAGAAMVVDIMEVILTMVATHRVIDLGGGLSGRGVITEPTETITITNYIDLRSLD